MIEILKAWSWLKSKKFWLVVVGLFSLLIMLGKRLTSFIKRKPISPTISSTNCMVSPGVTTEQVKEIEKKRAEDITKKYAKERDEWAKKFGPKILLLIALTSQLDGCRHVIPVSTPIVERPWALLSDNCIPPTDQEPMVKCKADAYFVAGNACILLAEKLEQCQNISDATCTLGVIDLQECNREKIECAEKLDNPWRSPWLWAIIGLVAGGAIGFGVGYSN